MSDHQPTNGLRFGALIRVSTERQEKLGSSLRTQREQLSGDVTRLGGSIAEWYGGQEHATPGHEKWEIERLLRDAAEGKFDAVIVAKADRWSRDNTQSKGALRCSASTASASSSAGRSSTFSTPRPACTWA